MLWAVWTAVRAAMFLYQVSGRNVYTGQLQFALEQLLKHTAFAYCNDVPRKLMIWLRFCWKSIVLKFLSHFFESGTALAYMVLPAKHHISIQTAWRSRMTLQTRASTLGKEG